MSNNQKFFMNGEWIDPQPGSSTFEVLHPGNEEPIATIAMGSEADVAMAVAAAKDAFETWQFVSVEERIGLLERIKDLYLAKYDAFTETMSREMGTCLSFSREIQTPCGDGHIQATIDALKAHEFERPSPRGGSILIDEPIGVCGLITPWNWPVNQVIVKVAPALAAGCTMVLKPSEYSPLSAIMLAEIIDEAGCPPGVFNLINGDGIDVGAPLTRHPDVDMVSFTGSTRAGIAISKAAADTVKRVALELGGKSPNLVFADADLEQVAEIALDACFNNNGQSCDAGSRLLVERSVYQEVTDRVAEAVRNTRVDDPMKDGDHIGPVVNKKQFDNIQRLIQAAIDEGTTLLVGGTGLPQGFNQGYYVRPTVFSDVTNDMIIAREEVFGPVIAIMPFDTEEEAIKIANETPYGLSAFIQSTDKARIDRVSRKLRAGSINVNGAAADYDVPFGGYKQSGNSKENGPFALEEYLDTKAVNQ